jgi:ADP-heptose:LPS heptosyltransferase
VAVLRALQLGDVLCAVPALRALRAALPDAEIVLVGLPWSAGLARRFPRYLDDVLVLPGYPGLPEHPAAVRDLPRMLARAHGRRLDLAIQLHGSGGITNPLAALLDAARLAGFFVPGEYCPDATSFMPYPTEGSEVRRLLALMSFLGVAARGEHLEFPVYEADVAALRRVPAAARLGPGAFVCLHPGGRAVADRWPPGRFAAVGDALAASGLAVALTGTAGEAPLTRAVATRMRAPAVDLAGRTTLGVLAALLSDARLLVSNDTGVSHLAAALGVPSVVLFAPAKLDRWAPLDRERHRPLAPVRDVTPDLVLDTVRTLLDKETACLPCAS